MSFQIQVMDMLDKKPMSTNDIHRNIGMSINYVRTQLRMMESANLIERVDDRTPVIYKLSDKNPILLDRERISNAKKALLMTLEQTKSDPILTGIKAYPKSQWAEWGEKLIVLGNAIRELDDDGMLVDTL